RRGIERPLRRASTAAPAPRVHFSRMPPYLGPYGGTTGMMEGLHHVENLTAASSRGRLFAEVVDERNRVASAEARKRACAIQGGSKLAHSELQPPTRTAEPTNGTTRSYPAGASIASVAAVPHWVTP